eukprot:PhF_6_TR17338/c0_g1_i1/m.26556
MPGAEVYRNLLFQTVMCGGHPRSLSMFAEMVRNAKGAEKATLGFPQLSDGMSINDTTAKTLINESISRTMIPMNTVVDGKSLEHLSAEGTILFVESNVKTNSVRIRVTPISLYAWSKQKANRDPLVRAVYSVFDAFQRHEVFHKVFERAIMAALLWRVSEVVKLVPLHTVFPSVIVAESGTAFEVLQEKSRWKVQNFEEKFSLDLAVMQDMKAGDHFVATNPYQEAVESVSKVRHINASNIEVTRLFAYQQKLWTAKTFTQQNLDLVSKKFDSWCRKVKAEHCILLLFVDRHSDELLELKVPDNVIIFPIDIAYELLEPWSWHTLLHTRSHFHNLKTKSQEEEEEEGK